MPPVSLGSPFLLYIVMIPLTEYPTLVPISIPSMNLQLDYRRINGGKVLLPNFRRRRRRRRIRIRAREGICDAIRLQHGKEGGAVEEGFHANYDLCGVLPLSCPCELRLGIGYRLYRLNRYDIHVALIDIIDCRF